MKYDKNSKTHKNIVNWLKLQTIFMIISSVISFCLVELGLNKFELNTHVLLESLGIILPMVCFLTIINYIFAKKFSKEVNKLEKALEMATKGNYNAKLDPNEATIFIEAYINFNKLEEELKKANTLQEEFVNNYSHEFKTPINSIKGFAELILNEKLTKEEKRRYLSIIIEESNKLKSLAENSILLTKLNSQAIVPNKKEYLLDEQIRRCVILFEPIYTKKKLKFTCNLDETNYYGSEELMEHLWNNLISNAIKYTNENGNVIINLKNKNDIIEVSIIDDGVGISPSDLKNIFNKFYQVDKSKTTKGLGLGLTIVSRILELIGGKITVESKLKKGTKFKITLPKK